MPGVPPARYAYLGPEGTFTEQALRTLPAAAKADLQPCSTVTLALDAVRGGEADGAVVPIENSVEGSVPVTLDELATGEPLMITREMTVPIAFSLLARPGTSADDVRRVATHPHAAAQTRRWVALHLPRAEVVHTSSTAQAAFMLTREDREWDAAISAPVAAEHYRLATLATGIADNPDALTRFVLVSRPGPPPPPTGADKTSLVAFMREDHPGALMEILEQLAMRGVNMTRIESRPTGAALGNYCFSVDCEGHVDDARVGEALMGLRRVCADVRFLGSYERHDGIAPTIRPGTSDREFLDAAAWLARLRHGS
ncbi:prephenate dehydratase [Nocardioides mesophilus]|uniref:Prephenate dehydratase n=1 Tax=Nocardioides mesophilus TaxID=433659 RepID=A0A7G9RFZ7_9ACTN|nr:prephenate dehydratase [Nocardioides mesophilus]QNN54522.1 prephenate dehydratase [Nocardioides mesophilus]